MSDDEPEETEAAYRRALAAAEEELARLTRTREEIELRIASLRHTCASLAALCGAPRRTELGLSDACRTVLQAAAGSELTPVEVRDYLVALGYDLSRYANPMAVIHTVLKRLVDGGQLEAESRADGKTAYRWRPAPRVVVWPRGLPWPSLADLGHLRGGRHEEEP